MHQELMRGTTTGMINISQGLNITHTEGMLIF